MKHILEILKNDNIKELINRIDPDKFQCIMCKEWKERSKFSLPSSPWACSNCIVIGVDSSSKDSVSVIATINCTKPIEYVDIKFVV